MVLALWPLAAALGALVALLLKPPRLQDTTGAGHWPGVPNGQVLRTDVPHRSDKAPS